MPQVFPPDNGQGPITFRRSYLDDIHGIPVTEDLAVRDLEGRLVDVRDIDQPDRDHLMQGWTLRDDTDPADP